MIAHRVKYYSYIYAFAFIALSALQVVETAAAATSDSCTGIRTFYLLKR